MRNRLRCLIAVLCGVLSSTLSLAQNQADLQVAKTVDASAPAPGNPVEFTVTVSNFGPDTASEIEVLDRLPDGMSIPQGMGAFTSQGSYDDSSGVWRVGVIANGQSAVLALPAIADDVGTPACFANVAEIASSSASDPRQDNDSARAVVLANGASLCTKLVLSMEATAEGSDGGCFGQSIDFVYHVTNEGPSIARNVEFTLSASAGEETWLQPKIVPVLGVGQSARVLTSWFVIGPFDRFVLNYTAQLSSDTLLFSDSTTEVNGAVDVASAIGECEIVNPGPGQGGGCFIATAAYGSHLDPHVVKLREFRDEHLLTNGLGRRLVAFYYTYSPPLAAVIEDSEFLRLAARAVLTPVVYAVAFPRVALPALLFLFLGSLLIARSRRRKRLGMRISGPPAPTRTD